MIVVGGENLIDYVQISEEDELPITELFQVDLVTMWLLQLLVKVNKFLISRQSLTIA